MTVSVRALGFGLLQVTGGVPSQQAYALTTLPGHHTTSISYGGYCYVNHSAVAARLLRRHFDKVAVSGGTAWMCTLGG